MATTNLERVGKAMDLLTAGLCLNGFDFLSVFCLTFAFPPLRFEPVDWRRARRLFCHPLLSCLIATVDKFGTSVAVSRRR